MWPVELTAWSEGQSRQDDICLTYGPLDLPGLFMIHRVRSANLHLTVALEIHILRAFSPPVNLSFLFFLSWNLNCNFCGGLVLVSSCFLPVMMKFFWRVRFICSVLKKWDELKSHLIFLYDVVCLVFPCTWSGLLCWIYYFYCFSHVLGFLLSAYVLEPLLNIYNIIRTQMRAHWSCPY